MDLNILVQRNKIRDSKDLIISKIKRALKLEYHTLAINVHIECDEIVDIPEPPIIELNERIKLYTRLTVKVEDTVHTHRLNQSPIAKKYDIISIEPLNDKMLNHINNGQFECDIITFDMTDRILCNIKRANFSVPISRGIFLEINYSDALSNQSIRQSVISNAQILVDKTKGRNILFSSRAYTPFVLRSPHDVANLGLLFGMKENQCNESISVNALKVIKNSELRKNVNMNGISVGTPLDSSEKWLINELKEF